MLWVSLIHGKDVEMAGRGGIPFTFHRTPAVYSIHPMFGYVNGGTTVTIRGLNLHSSSHDSPMCLFHFPEGQVTVPAETRQNNISAGEVGQLEDSESEIVCVTPPSIRMRPGRIPLEIAWSDGTITTSGKFFHYSHPVLLTGLFPSSSSDRSKNLSLTFSGIGFPASSDGWCKFRLNNGINVVHQEVRTPAIFKSDVKLMCPSPEWPYHPVTNDVLTLSVDIVWNEYGEENAASPALPFILYPSIELWSANPSSSGPDGGSVLSIHALNLPQDR